MQSKNIKTEIYNLIDSYVSGNLTKQSLISCAKQLFYDVIKMRNIPVDAVEMYYFVTSIIDGEDLSDDMYYEVIKRLLDIVIGKKNHKCCFVTRLVGFSVSEDIQILCDVIQHMRENKQLNSIEKACINRIVSNCNVNICSLSDMLYDRIINLLKLCIFTHSESHYVSIAKSLYVEDEDECVRIVLDSIYKYIECLRGERSFVICVEYNNGDISTCLID